MTVTACRFPHRSRKYQGVPHCPGILVLARQRLNADSTPPAMACSSACRDFPEPASISATNWSYTFARTAARHWASRSSPITAPSRSPAETTADGGQSTPSQERFPHPTADPSRPGHPTGFPPHQHAKPSRRRPLPRARSPRALNRIPATVRADVEALSPQRLGIRPISTATSSGVLDETVMPRPGSCGPPARPEIPTGFRAPDLCLRQAW